MNTGIDKEEKMDDFEMDLLMNFPVVDIPLKHTFAKNIYIREMFMPQGSLLTSKIHNTEHPFVVLQGKILIYNPGEEVICLAAGHSGITEPGTRRAGYAVEDVRWATYHVLSEEEEEARVSGADEEVLLEMIEDRIIEKRMIPGMEDVSINDFYKALLEEEVLCLGSQ